MNPTKLKIHGHSGWAHLLQSGDYMALTPFNSVVKIYFIDYKFMLEFIRKLWQSEFMSLFHMIFYKIRNTTVI